MVFYDINLNNENIIFLLIIYCIYKIQEYFVTF